MKSHTHFKPTIRIYAVLLVLLLGSLACTFSLADIPFLNPGPTSEPQPAFPEPTPIPSAEMQFEAQLLQPLNPGESLAISILDEVTGLSLNAVNFQMQPVDALRYQVSLPVPVGSVVTYRYLRLGSNTAIESTGLNKTVRYRIVQVAGPGRVTDIVSGWSDRPFLAGWGTIQGQVRDAQSDKVVPNVLITAAGMQTFTDSQGRFLLRGLPAGVHNLVAYEPNGAYRIFQQGAQVGDTMVTPVPIRLQPAIMVTVTFNVRVPADTVVGAPLRMVGNLSQLGNTFSDLNGGVSTLADRAPTMSRLEDGRYTLTLSLPAGADLRYKYSLGDGFWNSEQKQTGGFQVRQLIVPTVNTVIEDSVATWKSGPNSSILFEVTVPELTPISDTVSIQFNPYGWTEPIPMWPMGNNRWTYKLYGPLNLVGNFGYRYCRNAQCGSADDIATVGRTIIGRRITTSLTPQSITDKVSGWKWLPDTTPATLVQTPITARGSSFTAGVELQPSWHPGWKALMPQTLQNIKAINANWVIITPGWTQERISPLILNPVAGVDAQWDDLKFTIDRARALNMNVAVFPTPGFPIPVDNWWYEAPRDLAWWEDWFDRYRTFLLHHADLAAQTNASVLIMGGDWLAPALPGGLLVDGTSSGVPADVDARWRGIISDIRARYAGQIWWAQPYPGLELAPGFLSEVDGIYLLWDMPVSRNESAAKMDMLAEINRLFDEQVQPWQAPLQKPVVIASAYPSAVGAARACVNDQQGGCLEWQSLGRPHEDRASVTLDLQGQADFHEAMLTAVQNRQWINGFISRGYYPPVSLRDKSASVHGKPAADVLWYWFARLLGTSQ